MALNGSWNLGITTDALRRLWVQMSRRQRRQFFRLLVLMFFGAIAEAATLGALLPFLARIADPNAVGDQSLVSRQLQGLGLAGSSDNFLPLLLLFSAVAV
ncbi:hypothetical protein EN811_26925, partial [bacterium M00.F.Ca.ET.168.01.1.1]